MKTFALALVTLAAAPVYAQTGHWKGTIEIPNNPVAFEIDIARNAAGAFVGTATAGVDRATLPLQKIAVDGTQLSFFARTDQPFSGELSADGKSVSGTATLSGYALPFSMGRTGDATIEPRPVSPAVSHDLEGVWTGTIAGAQREFHFVLTIANQPDGTALAHEISADEGDLMIYVVVKQNGRQVQLESRGVVTSFTGELNAMASEITGTWSQGPTSLPLTLTRARVEGAR